MNNPIVSPMPQETIGSEPTGGDPLLYNVPRLYQPSPWNQNQYLVIDQDFEGITFVVMCQPLTCNDSFVSIPSANLVLRRTASASLKQSWIQKRGGEKRDFLQDGYIEKVRSFAQGSMRQDRQEQLLCGITYCCSVISLREGNGLVLSIAAPRPTMGISLSGNRKNKTRRKKIHCVVAI